MGTRSAIGIQNSDGSIKAIYCHWDGYPSWNGRILKDYYTDETKVRDLIALGDISSLRAEIGEQHPFDTYHLKKEDIDSRWENWTTAYGRDRGETDIDARDYVSANDFYNRFDMGVEYIYLFKDGEWIMNSVYGKTEWIPVTVALEEKEEA